MPGSAVGDFDQSSIATVLDSVEAFRLLASQCPCVGAPEHNSSRLPASPVHLK